jgi:hypothetical protein
MKIGFLSLPAGCEANVPAGCIYVSQLRGERRLFQRGGPAAVAYILPTISLPASSRLSSAG